MEESQEKEEQPRYQKPKTISRRKFITKSILLTGVVATYVAGSSALFYNAAVKSKKNSKIAREPQNNLVMLGDVSKFDNLTEVTKVDYKTEIEDGWVKQNIDGFVYATKNEKNELLLMSPVCTHLGCTVPFASKEEQKSIPNLVFKCPCHGGEFDKLGRNIGGPPPRPLDVFKPIIKEGKVYFDYFSSIQRKR